MRALRLTLLMAGLGTAAEAQQTPITVGGITAQSGARASGVLPVAAGRDSGTRIPITIVRGAGTP